MPAPFGTGRPELEPDNLIVRWNIGHWNPGHPLDTHVVIIDLTDTDEAIAQAAFDAVGRFANEIGAAIVKAKAS